MSTMKTGTVLCLLVCWWGDLSHAATSDIDVEISPATVRLAAPRSPNHPLKLAVDAFDQKHHLTLSPAPSPFSPKFKLQRTSRDSLGALVIQDADTTDITSLYHDPTTGGVLSVDGSRVEGLLTPTIAIKPSDDGDHFVLRQYNATPSTHLTDYLELPEHLRHVRKFSRTPRAVVSVTPELYVIVDSTLAAALGTDTKVKEYLGVFWNAVNHRFATMDDPKVQVMLSGALIVRNSADEAYINDNVITQNYIHGSNTLGSVSDWLYQNKDSLPAYDLAYLMTGKDMADVQSNQIQKGLAGIAWRGAACVVASGNKRAFNTGMGEDMGVYYHGVMTAAHELAHNLGSPHDGTDGAEACSWDLGYIMSYVTGSRNKLFFSSCSQKLMKEYISSSDGACLRSNSVGPVIPISSQLPGSIVSIDEQCQKATGKSNAYASKSVATDDELCVQLQCQWQQKDGRWTYTYTQRFSRPAAEGSPCRSGGVCTNGVCK